MGDHHSSWWSASKSVRLLCKVQLELWHSFNLKLFKFFESRPSSLSHTRTATRSKLGLRTLTTRFYVSSQIEK